MSIIIELLTSNSRRARVFRIFPYLMLGLIGLDYLFSKQLDTSVPKEENSLRISETVAAQKVNTSLQNTEADDHEILKAKAITNTIERIESICLHKKPLPIHERKANFDYMSGQTLRNRTSSKMKLCENLDKLGQVKTHLRQISLEKVDNKYPKVKWGGLYSPRNCTAKYKVAIIIPYRDRRDNLAVLLNHLHPFLIMQKVVEYGIFVVEQFGTNLFNRGKLMNIAVVETDNLQPGYWECFIFHDADLLPENAKNLYSCPKMPRHMASAVDIYEYKLRAEKAFGGVIALTRQQFYRVNGFSNSFWGWGGEDNDMVYRLDYCNYNITRYRQDIGRYIMLRHSKPDPNPLRYDLILSKGRNYREDGLTTLNYRVVNICQNHLFTHILVDIDFPATAQDIE